MDKSKRKLYQRICTTTHRYLEPADDHCIASVLVQAQFPGRAIPQRCLLSRDALEQYYLRLAAWLFERSIVCAELPLPMHKYGNTLPMVWSALSEDSDAFDAYKHLIAVNNRLGAADRLLTLFHEAAHVFAGHSLARRSGTRQPFREIVAELAGIAAASHLGLHMEQSAADYLATWREEIPAFVEHEPSWFAIARVLKRFRAFRADCVLNAEHLPRRQWFRTFSKKGSHPAQTPA